MADEDHIQNCEKRYKIAQLYNTGQIDSEQFCKGMERYWMLNRIKKKARQALGIYEEP